MSLSLTHSHRAKFVLLGLFLMLALGWALHSRPAQAQPQKAAHFLVILEARPTFLADATPDEQKAMQGHVAHLMKLDKSGQMVFGGRRTNAPYAVLVLEAASQQEAERLVAEDPGVRAGILKPQVHAFMLVFQRKP